MKSSTFLEDQRHITMFMLKQNIWKKCIVCFYHRLTAPKIDLSKFGSSYMADGPSLNPRADAGLPSLLQADEGLHPYSRLLHGKRVLRFWIIICYCLLQGTVSYARATLDKQSCVITPTFVYHD